MVRVSPAQQQDLHALQEIDTAIRRLEHRRANLAEQRALDLESSTLHKVEAELADAKERLQGLEARSRRHEQEIGDIESRRRTDEARMYGGRIQSEKELEALRHELGALRSRKSDIEDELLEIMQEVEDLGGLVQTLNERSEELHQTVGTLSAARDEAATEIDADLREQREARAATAAKIPGPLLETYDTLRAKKNGVAVALLEGRTCTGCRLELTAIELEEIKETARESLARCQQCGRILIAG